MPESKLQAHGNADVVAALEHFLAKAKEGLIGYTAILCFQEPDKVSSYFGGSIHLLPEAVKAVGTFQGMMQAKWLNCELPPRDETLGADYVCYNACTAPLSFDFLAWLIDAEMTRRRRGAPYPLKVHFWFGRDGTMGLGLPSRKIMLENVCRPMLGLIGAIETDNSGGWFTAVCTTRGIAEASRAGEPVPKFHSTAAVPPTSTRRLSKPPVTITLREAVDWPHRNSNIEAWFNVADYLKARGEDVVFVRETAKAYDELPLGYDICPQASIDLHSRMALYQFAKANLFVSNGPGTLAWFSDKPWLMFVQPEPEVAPEGQHIYAPNTPKAWRENMGLEVGQQWPWSRPDQRMIWGKDEYDSIIAAWEKFIAPSLKRAA